MRKRRIFDQRVTYTNPRYEMVFIYWQLNLKGLYLQVVFVQRWSLKGGVNPLNPSDLSTFHSTIPFHWIQMPSYWTRLSYQQDTWNWGSQPYTNLHTRGVAYSVSQRLLAWHLHTGFYISTNNWLWATRPCQNHMVTSTCSFSNGPWGCFVHVLHITFRWNIHLHIAEWAYNLFLQSCYHTESMAWPSLIYCLFPVPKFSTNWWGQEVTINY